MPTAPSVKGRRRLGWRRGEVSRVVRARVASQCLNLHAGSDWMTDPLLLKKLNIFQLFDGTVRTDPPCIMRPSPFKVNGDQSMDGGSGHEASGLVHTTCVCRRISCTNALPPSGSRCNSRVIKHGFDKRSQVFIFVIHQTRSPKCYLQYYNNLIQEAGRG